MKTGDPSVNLFKVSNIKYFTISPPEHLTKYVRFFWVLEGEADEGQPFIHRTMADGCADILFHYKGQFDKLSLVNDVEKCFTAGVQAQSHQFKRFIADRQFGMFGVYLYPYAIPELFAIASCELTNEMPRLRDILGKGAIDLEEQMVVAADHAERVRICSAFLEKRLPFVKRTQSGLTETIKEMMQSDKKSSLEELASRNFLSVRQFERNFKTFSGFSPKHFSRLMRFQASLKMQHDKNKSLTEIAYDCGYYDQSHFIHDFKAFSGYNPKSYFSGKVEGLASFTS